MFKSAALLATVTILFSVPAFAVDSPPLHGQMETFELAEKARPRPGIAWTTPDGEAVTLAEFEGKVVLMNFWATWCAPCLRELPSLDRLANGLDAGIAVVAISIDRQGEAVAGRTMRKLALTDLKLYLDAKSAAARALKVQQMPTTIMFDRHGREIGRLQGAAEWDSEEARALLRYVTANPDHLDALPTEK